jgi:hypothetical protein
MQIGKDQTNAMIELQKEVFSAYEEAGRAWIARVKSEVELWSDLAAKLSSSKSVPDGLVACQDYVAQRMRMAAEDGRRLFEEGQKIIGTISRSMPNGPKAGT